MEKTQEKERKFPDDYVDEAIETADHLLWEAIIRVYDTAISKAFQIQRDLGLKTKRGFLVREAPFNNLPPT